jgi:uncharacterized Zn-binding protein involved in type VI secretion
MRYFLNIRLAASVLLLFSLISVLFLFLQPAQGATVTWDGGGADNNWSTPENWSTDLVPGSSDSVVFDGTSSKNVTVDVSDQVTNFTVSDAYAGTITQQEDLVITGNLSLDSAFVVDGALLDIRSNANFLNDADFSLTNTTDRLRIYRNFTVDPAATSSIDFNQGSLQFIGQTDTTFSCGISGDVNTSFDIGTFFLDKGFTSTQENLFTFDSGCDITINDTDQNTAAPDSARVVVPAGSTLTFNGTAEMAVGSLVNNGNVVIGSTVTRLHLDSLGDSLGDSSQRGWIMNAGSTFNVLSTSFVFRIDADIVLDPTLSYVGVTPDINLNESTMFIASYRFRSTTISCGFDGDFNATLNIGHLSLDKNNEIEFTFDEGCDVTINETFNSNGSESPRVIVPPNTTLTLDGTGLYFGSLIVEGSVHFTENANFVILESDQDVTPARGLWMKSGSSFTSDIPATVTLFQNAIIEDNVTWDINDIEIHIYMVGFSNAYMKVDSDIGDVRNFRSRTNPLVIEGTGSIRDLILNDGLIYGCTSDVSATSGVGVTCLRYGSTVPASTTLSIKGDLLDSTSDLVGSDSLIFDISGTGDQNISIPGNFDATLNINKTSGDVEMTGPLNTGSTCTLSDVDFFHANGHNISCSGGFVTEDPNATLVLNGDESISSLTITDLGAVEYVGNNDAAPDNFAIADVITTFPGLIIDADDGQDTFELSSNIDVNGDITLDGGNLDAGDPTSRDITLSGDWIDGSGAFVARESTVTLDGTGQEIVGSTSFYRLSKTVASGDTLTLPSGETVTITNQMTLQGADDTNQLALRSSTPGVQSNLDPEGARTISALDVQDNNNTSGTELNCESDCTDSGNNTNWEFTNPGITVSPSSVSVAESGTTDTFTVVLDAAPTDSVTIPVNSNDTSEGIIDVVELIFTTGNWDTPQTVTLTGIDDDLPDGDVSYSIILGSITSNDAAYDGLDPGDVSATTTNDDTATATVSAMSGNTTEDGGTATFTVVLDAAPLENVTIPVSSSDTGEGTVSPASLVFTPSTWDEAQTVTVTGVSDNLLDGDISFDIVLAAMESADGDFDGVNPDDVTVINEDTNTAQLFLNKTTVATSENGSTDTVRITSSVIPNGDIVISFASSDTDEVATPNDVTLNSSNWSSGAILTLTGVDDALIDGDQTATITDTGISASLGGTSDADFEALNLSDITVTNSDDEPAYTVSAISGDTDEVGTTATFTVELAAEPTNDVVIAVASSDTTEGTVSPSSLTFTSGDWDTPQTVTVTGVDDDVEDGDILYSVNLGPAVSDDSRFDGTSPSSVSVTNIDDGDTAGVTVSAISGDTSEDGTTATFTVVLTAAPASGLSIPISSSDTSEGTVSTASLSFNSGNWDTPQTVTVTGVDDAVVDGDIDYSVIIGAVNGGGAAFSGINPDDITLTNLDNNNPGVNVVNAGLEVSETGTTDTFTIALGESPVDSVVIDIASSDTGEATVSPSSVSFDTDNWDEPQTITIAGVDDDFVDGTQSPSITLTVDQAASDSGYDNLSIDSESVSVLDDDNVSISLSNAVAVVEEGGGLVDSFSITLDSRPSADVSFDLIIEDSTEVALSSVDVRWDAGTVTFDGTNWDVPLEIDVSAVDDIDVDGNQVTDVTFGAFTSSDLAFSGFTPPETVEVTTGDNDTFGVTVTPLSGAVSESGATATFTVVLQSEPTDDVAFSLALDDATEATATPSSLTFTSANWDDPQTVVLSAIDDFVDDGNTDNGITISTTSDDTDYDEYTRDSFEFGFSVVDNEIAQVIIVQTDGLTRLQEGGTDTYSIQLSTEPLDDVTITITSGDSDQLTVQPQTLVFTPADWNQSQTVTVQGVVDTDVENDEVITVTHTATSLDPDYEGILIPNINAILENRIFGTNSFIAFPVEPELRIQKPQETLSVDGDSPVRISWDVVVQESPFVRVEARNANSGGGSWVELTNGPTRENSFLIDDFSSLPDGDLEVRAVLTDLKDDIAEDSIVMTILRAEPQEEAAHNDEPSEDDALNESDDSSQDNPSLFPEGLQAGDLVKGPVLSAVYMLSEDGTRKPFFNERIFFSYGLSFDDLKVVSKDVLASIPLGTMVAPQEDYLLLFTGEPHVYQILNAESPFTLERRVELLRVENEEAARSAYGIAWKDLIVSLPVSLFQHFSVLND